MRRFAAAPEMLDADAGILELTEAVARSLAPSRTSTWSAGGRGHDSREIVARCVEYVESTGSGDGQIL